MQQPLATRTQNHRFSNRFSIGLVLAIASPLLFAAVLYFAAPGLYRSEGKPAIVSAIASESAAAVEAEAIQPLIVEPEAVAAEPLDVPVSEVASARSDIQIQEQSSIRSDSTAALESAPAVTYSSRQIVLAGGGAGWDAVTRSQIDIAIQMLPQAVIQNLGNPALGPVIINVNSAGRTLSGQQPYGGPANFFSTNEGINELVLYPQQGVLTVLHELGHAYNLRHVAAASYAQVLLEPEMQSFLVAAGWRILTPAGVLANLQDQASVVAELSGPAIWPNLSRQDPLEDFANSFAYYFAAPETLQQLSPARYQWFATLF